MRFAALALALVGSLAAFSPAPESDPYVVLLSGDTDGYLAPCGCTKPMSGGIRRRVQAVKSLGVDGRTIILENAGLITGTGRQDQIKAETIAEALGKAGWDAINVGPAEARLGLGHLLALNTLSDGKLLASGLRPSEANEIAQHVAKGPFMVVGVAANPEAVAAPLGETPEPLRETIERAIEATQQAGLALMVLMQGDESEARELARSFPSIALIQFRSAGSPTKEPLREGKTWLVSPGEKGKHVLRLEFKEGSFTSYQAIDLGPVFHDDPTTSRLYGAYLDRVRSEKLLDRVPRSRTDAFAGNATCGKCHDNARKAWVASAHSGALATLEKERHDADPDCVSCHVVGLESTEGFRSRSVTPDLADVGCESCHGPGRAHAFHPTEVRMPKVGEKSCTPCHVPDHSPEFEFDSYWQRIRH